jgi:hypothetical protein
MNEAIFIPDFKPSLSAKVIEVAKGEIGKQEIPKGSNWGPEVKKYLNAVGINEPASWCMAFVYWCTATAAKALSINNPLYKTGGVMNQWYNAHPNNKILEHPQAGDIFIMEFKGGLGHTGIVESVDADHIYTIEGNSNNNGSRDGEEVVRNKRLITAIHGFIRLT